jgi:hypothetical protein
MGHTLAWASCNDLMHNWWAPAVSNFNLFPNRSTSPKTTHNRVVRQPRAITFPIDLSRNCSGARDRFRDFPVGLWILKISRSLGVRERRRGTRPARPNSSRSPSKSSARPPLLLDILRYPQLDAPPPGRKVRGGYRRRQWEEPRRRGQLRLLLLRRHAERE